MDDQPIKIEEIQMHLDKLDQFLSMICNVSNENTSTNSNEGFIHPQLINNGYKKHNRIFSIKLDTFKNAEERKISKENELSQENENANALKRFRTNCEKLNEYKFKYLKRENVDKKILKFVRKYIKSNPSYFKNDFLYEFSSNNYNPPFTSTKRNVIFKSLNFSYLKWLMSKDEIYQIILEIMELRFDSLLESLVNTYKITDDSTDKKLLYKYLKDYIHIYR